MPDSFAQIVFAISLKKSFTYRVPAALEGLVKPGMRCLVSFGRRQAVGLVMGLSRQAPGDLKGLKPIDSILDPEQCLGEDLMELGRWIADYYYCSQGEALFAIIPAGYRKAGRAFLQLTQQGLERQAEVESILAKSGTLRGVNWDSLKYKKIPLTARTRALAEALKSSGLADVLVAAIKDESGRKRKELGAFTQPHKLQPQQQKALDSIVKSLDAGIFHPFLLQGVTGSGKTEVYLQAISRTLSQGKQAIVLIPEIALTPQTVERFTGRFGDQVAVFHSRLSAGDRMREWRRMALGQAKVAVGARSALFAPAPKLGLIVVDEEHESTYKQEDAPRYHARDAAVKRAQICKAVALLGSATPSLESVQNARAGKYTLLTMPERINRRPLPEIKLVDLREEWAVRGEDRPVLSIALREAIRETLEKKEQVLLFLNRRGFQTLLLCMKCGEQVHCPSCAIPVTLHRNPGKVSGGAEGKPVVICHYCNWQGPLPETCAKCGDKAVRAVGLGTQKVEEEVMAAFPKARIARMDLDTTRKQGSHDDILGKFRKKEIDILIGTQMIAKGHDFPGITLVGVVGADVGLSLPDFRASERVFQLMVQVAGRAGRADKEGVIYLQTFHGEHTAIQAAVKHDTGAFWEGELELRKILEYPPFTRLGLMMYRSKFEKKAREIAEKAGVFLKKNASSLGVRVYGPAPAGIAKLRGHYRFQILLKAMKAQSIRQLVQFLDDKMTEPHPGVFRVVDLDPQSML